MTLDTDQSVLWRAVLEAIGYDYMEITDIYREAGADLSRVAITEGGSRDDLWNQMKSDMLGSKVITLKNAGGAVVTNCLFGAYAVNEVEDIRERLEGYLEIKKNYVPEAANTEKYRQLYEIQKRLVKQNMGNIFDILEQLRNKI